MSEKSQVSSAWFDHSDRSDRSDPVDNSRHDGFLELIPTEPTDPIRLKNETDHRLIQYFAERKLAFFDGQYQALQHINELVLRAPKNSVTAVPLVPGGGKSTYIRAFCNVLSKHLSRINEDPIAQKIGGTVIVVETSAEAHQLEDICVEAGGSSVVAVVESVNDSNLRQYGCPSGIARTYSECPRRSCEDYDRCNLAQAACRLNETPILIMLHARYQRYLEDLTGLAFWLDDRGTEHPRTILLVDELPNLFESNELSMDRMRKAEENLENALSPCASKNIEFISLMFNLWEWNVRVPFMKMVRQLSEKQSAYGLVPDGSFKEAGFEEEKLKKLRSLISSRVTECEAINVIDTILANKPGFYSYGKAISVNTPALKKFDKSSGFSTILFSGTAQLAPELTCSGASVVECPMPESYARLTIIVQRSDRISASRTGLSNAVNRAAVAAWILEVLSKESVGKILVATYKPYSEPLWNALGEAQNRVFPYTDRNGHKEERLPYFGGMNGSNDYSAARCIICAGINRFQPNEYLNRYLAMGLHTDMLLDNTGNVSMFLSNAKPVMDLQDHYLAADIIQLVFRSDLRNHGSSEPIHLYLFQPPEGVIAALLSFFHDCKLHEVEDLPDACYLAANSKHRYNGQQTNVRKLTEFLSSTNEDQITPSEIRKATGLSQSQYKEAMKNQAIRKLMAERFLTYGSGKNTVYYKRAA